MVNTFMTSSSFTKCAKNLDNQRLGKQRVEAMQIIDLLVYYDKYNEFPKQGFSNHPAVKMWINHTDALKHYCNCMINEWISRGYKNTMQIYDLPDDFERPWWLNFRPLHYSHRAALIRKNPEYYEFLKGIDSKVYDYMDYGYLWLDSRKFISDDEYDMSMLSPIGSGAPANYQLTRNEVLLWMKDKSKNPKTGRNIKETGGIYKLYEKAKKIYGL